MATISAGPKIQTAMHPALANRMQVVIDIALCASLSTVIVTVLATEAIALIAHQPIITAMTPFQTVLAAMALIVAAISLSDGKTNPIEDITHFVLFGTFQSNHASVSQGARTRRVK